MIKHMAALCCAAGLLAGLCGCTRSGGGSNTPSAISGATTAVTETTGTGASSSASETVSAADSSASEAVTTEKTTVTTEKTTVTTAPAEPLSQEERNLLEKIAVEERAWLASMQLENGALPMTYSASGVLTMNPYFADFAALALLDEAGTYGGHVKAYIGWHLQHLNTAQTDYNGVDGTIYDYKISMRDGRVTGEAITVSNGKNLYDSTDSYAATFLCVLWKYYEKTGDKSYIVSERENIRRVVNAMFATMHNGLTFAKPDYRIKYLMDNCEVYAGMSAAAQLYKAVICPEFPAENETLARLENGAETVKAAIDGKMWNVRGYYEAAIDSNDAACYSFSWDNFYPCATAQLFPVSFGVIAPDSARAQALYDGFCNHYSWETFQIPDSFYWGSNVYAAAVMNDKARVYTYMSHYQKAMKKHAYPLYNADAAKVCMAAQKMLDNNA